MTHSYPALLDQRISFPLDRLVQSIGNQHEESVRIWNERFPHSPFVTDLKNLNHKVQFPCPFSGKLVMVSLGKLESLMNIETSNEKYSSQATLSVRDDGGIKSKSPESM
jgi:hypothetical protein